MGASTDILDEIAFAHINQKNNITLQPSSKHLLAYGSNNQLAARGHSRASKTDNATHCYIHVLEGDHGLILSCKTATASSWNSQCTSEPHTRS